MTENEYVKSRNELIRILPSKIDTIVFDFDGVFTNNEVIIHEDGTESVICNRSDGLGISLLHDISIPMLIISTEENPVVSERAKKLKIPVVQGIKYKEKVLLELLTRKNIDLQNVIYVGNDLNDLNCMKLVGTSIVTSDAHTSVKSIADIVLLKSGGKGAVRELVDYIIMKKEREIEI